MADSNITKRALAASFKELLEIMPFDKITIADICEGCGMNRKSFYYHFKDKYDLVNWIFDTEFLDIAQNSLYDDSLPLTDRRDVLVSICEYFYRERSFYGKLLKIKGQNCLFDHFRELFHPLFIHRMEQYTNNANITPFYVNFFADAFICSIERWITDKDPMPPEQFIELLLFCIQMIQQIPLDELKQ